MTKLWNQKDLWGVHYWDEDKEMYTGFIHSENADTEADARAKMLIYLLENKLIEL